MRAASWFENEGKVLKIDLKRFGVLSIQLDQRFIEKIERMKLLIAKNIWSGGLAPLSTTPRKDMGRASSSSAPLIPATLKKIKPKNFQDILRIRE